MNEKLIEGLREQHRRDSAELRRLCAERDQLKGQLERLKKHIESAWESDDREHEMRVDYEESLKSLVWYIQETAQMRTLLLDLHAAQAALEAAREDAERYRWLRDEARTNRAPHIFQYPAQSFDHPQYPHFKDVGLDAAIDAARKEAPID